MTTTPLLDDVRAIRSQEAPAWDERDRPLLIADGRLIRLKELRADVRATQAYAVGVRPPDLDRLARHLTTEALVLYDVQVPDLTPLQHLGGLQWLALSWNTKVTSLDPLTSLRHLTRLTIDDTPKVRDLEPLASLTSLVALEYSGGIWNRNTALTLEPISRLPVLEELRLTNLKVFEGGLRPLAASRSLRRLDVSNQFDTADYAYLSVALPEVDCASFAPYVDLVEGSDEGRTVMVIGTRKPFLDKDRDAVRLARYRAEFERLQATFRAER